MYHEPKFNKIKKNPRLTHTYVHINSIGRAS